MSSQLENTPAAARSKGWYLPFLICISGMGGLLAGVDFGIIGGALLYVDKTIPMTEAQLGFMVSIYFIGGLVASLFAGGMADWLGRKKTMVAAGLIFVSSILLIYTSQGFYSLLAGRVLMGLSGGMICVVVPLYMAECLPSSIRGRGTSGFGFGLVFGLLVASFVGKYFTGIHDNAVLEAKGDTALIFAADDSAWRNMFLFASIPGILFTIGSLWLKESPRWLFRRNRADQALSILRLSRSEDQAALEMREMKEHATNNDKDSGDKKKSSGGGTLLQRKYVIPFILACVVLACNQATGINSIIAYAAKIVQGAGASEQSAASSFTIIMSVNCVFTLIGVLLVDKLGRKILLTVGTLGVVITLFSAGMLYRQFESKRIDVLTQVQAGLSEDKTTLKIDLSGEAFAQLNEGAPGQLSVLYNLISPEGKSKPGIATAFSNSEKAGDRVLTIEPEVETRWETDADGNKIEVTKVKDSGTLELRRATYAPIPAKTTGWWITVILCVFMAFFAVGPGLVVWLALSELMPTRIRSMGMGVAMFLNNGVQFLSGFFFPIVVGGKGFSAMFFIWGGFAVIYFITAAFFMPETKGKTLEEIEDHFAGKKGKA